MWPLPGCVGVWWCRGHWWLPWLTQRVKGQRSGGGHTCTTLQSDLGYQAYVIHRVNTYDNNNSIYLQSVYYEHFDAHNIYTVVHSPKCLNVRNVSTYYIVDHFKNIGL